MNRIRKRTLGIAIALVVLTGTLTGILGWKNQLLRLPAPKPAAAQSTPAGVDQLPILSQPILR